MENRDGTSLCKPTGRKLGNFSSHLWPNFFDYSDEDILIATELPVDKLLWR